MFYFVSLWLSLGERIVHVFVSVCTKIFETLPGLRSVAVEDLIGSDQV